MNVGDLNAVVRRIDTASMSVTSSLLLGHRTTALSESDGPGLPNYLNAPVLSSDGSTAFLPSKQDNIAAGLARNGVPFTFDQRVRAATARLDLAGNTENPNARIAHDNASNATGAALTGDGTHLFVALETSREVVAYNLELGFPVMRIDVGRAPQSVALSSDGRQLYVHNFMDRTVTTHEWAELSDGHKRLMRVLRHPIVLFGTLAGLGAALQKDGRSPDPTQLVSTAIPPHPS